MSRIIFVSHSHNSKNGSDAHIMKIQRHKISGKLMQNHNKAGQNEFEECLTKDIKVITF